MSGHSKWSKIKRKKGSLDAKKGKIFTRCIYDITIAVKEGGGGDPGCNARLRLAIEKARAANMPFENIERALKRASGEGKGDEQIEITYEGYGPSGVAIMVDVITDNKNRTVGEVRHAFSRAGGSLGENGCVSWMFDKTGVILVRTETVDEDRLMELALESGAQDIKQEEGYWAVLTDVKELFMVYDALRKSVECEEASPDWVPKSRITLGGEDAEKVGRLLEALEGLDDVVNVSANCDFASEGEEI